ncbi:ADP-ribosylglycohydrolase family protein [Flavobacterium oreochromis]|uniref:ADP-ribosylglycohydrolase family protein n=1 Tax=Flavobacterium oreochromis TaxID=2906078 RepID=UPI001CE641F4|nr:ADP-ribosylglycohydrolase family protein [Flavobacterium oreochromis]QYS87462.1 ADP-ribosylglycohydrolase family protein [Flavobacterium oreochromis]
MKTKLVHSALFGVAVGDALGVPVEFKDRNELARFPVQGMKEYGSHGQPAGTWSDDSSLTFCLADSLCDGYNTNQLAQYFVNWRNEQMWTPHGRVFDIGIATSNAIYRISQGIDPILCGGFNIEDNGNGSLMRILPLVFYIKDKSIDEIYQITKEVSSITHAHFRSVFACFIYLVYALEIIKGSDKEKAYTTMQLIIADFLKEKDFNKNELSLFDRILKQNISSIEETNISSSGYVLHSLEASLWCVLTSNSYKETVLKAVNLGGDTDTTGAIAGGLAGLIYGYDAIPTEWINVLARKTDIENLCERLAKKYTID